MKTVQIIWSTGEKAGYVYWKKKSLDLPSLTSLRIISGRYLLTRVLKARVSEESCMNLCWTGIFRMVKPGFGLAHLQIRGPFHFIKKPVGWKLVFMAGMK